VGAEQYTRPSNATAINELNGTAPTVLVAQKCRPLKHATETREIPQGEALNISHRQPKAQHFNVSKYSLASWPMPTRWYTIFCVIEENDVPRNAEACRLGGKVTACIRACKPTVGILLTTTRPGMTPHLPAAAHPPALRFPPPPGKQDMTQVGFPCTRMFIGAWSLGRTTMAPSEPTMDIKVGVLSRQPVSLITWWLWRYTAPVMPDYGQG
jgi:hypothetical protein